MAQYLETVPDESLDYIWITAPQHGPEELALLPRLWAKLKPGGYMGGFWFTNCEGFAARYCRAAAGRVVKDVKDQVLDFAHMVGRNVLPTTKGAIKSWYFGK